MKKYRLASMKHYRLRGKWYRIWRWLKSPLRCKLGYHIPDWKNYGFAIGGNYMDIRCNLCRNSIMILIDDLDNLGLRKFDDLKVILRRFNDSGNLDEVGK